MEEEQKLDKRGKFEELYKKFTKDCLEFNILPAAMMGNDMRSIYAYISFVDVTDEEKKSLLSSI